MNTKKTAIIISGAILAAGAGGFLYWDNAYNFTGNERSIGNGGYYADFENFNGTDSFELQLEKGEKIHLDAHIDKGKADFCFYRKGEDNGYVISGIMDADTDVTADESSRYVVEVRAKHAKGVISVKADENVSDKTVYNTSKNAADNIGDIND